MRSIDKEMEVDRQKMQAEQMALMAQQQAQQQGAEESAEQ
jgi:hypothetical protein